MLLIRYLLLANLTCFLTYASKTVEDIREEAAECARISLYADNRTVGIKNPTANYDWCEKNLRELEEACKAMGIDDSANEPEPEEPDDYYRFEESSIRLISETINDIWLKNFAQQASAEAILYIASKNKMLFTIPEAQEKILLLEAPRLISVLMTHQELIPDFAKKASEDQVLAVCNLEKSLKEHLDIRVRLLRIEKNLSARSTKKNDSSLDDSYPKPLYKDYNRYRSHPSMGPGFYSDPRSEQRHQTKADREKLWQKFRERQQVSSFDSSHETLNSFIDLFEQHALGKPNSQELSLLLQGSSEQDIGSLCDKLNPEAFALSLDVLAQFLPSPESKKHLEEKVTSIRYSNDFDNLSPKAQSIVSDYEHAITMRKMRADTCVTALKKYLSHGDATYGGILMRIAVELQDDEDLAWDIESRWAGSTKKLLQIQAEEAYKKINTAVRQFKLNNNEQVLIQFAKAIDIHSKTPQFKKLFKHKSCKNVEFLNEKIAQYEENQRTIERFGITKKRLTDIADFFDIESSELTANYKNSEQNDIHIQGVKILNDLFFYAENSQEKKVLGDCAHIALTLNAHNKTKQARAILKNLEYVIDALAGAGQELLTEGIDQAKSAIIWLPVITAISAGLTLAGIPAAPAIALLGLGMTLYNISTRHAEMKAGLKEFAQAIERGEAYEVGKLAARLGLEVVATRKAYKNLHKIFSQALKKGTLDDVLKKIKKGAKIAKELEAEARSGTLKFPTDYDEKGYCPYPGNAIKTIKKAAFNHDHVFSENHVRDGILELGKSQEEIMHMFSAYVLMADKLNILNKEGDTTLRLLINKSKVTVRCHIKNGLLLNVDGFMGRTARELGRVIDFE